MTLPPPGWYPDPADPSGHRWWDGQQWTSTTNAPNPEGAAAISATEPQAPMAPVGGAVALPATAYGTPYPPSASALTTPAPRSFAQANRYSLITLGVVALYILVALTTRIVFIGILPVVMSIRGIRTKEKLAPVAVVAAVIAVIVAFAALSAGS